MGKRKAGQANGMGLLFEISPVFSCPPSTHHCQEPCLTSPQKPHYRQGTATRTLRRMSSSCSFTFPPRISVPAPTILVVLHWTYSCLSMLCPFSMLHSPSSQPILAGEPFHPWDHFCGPPLDALQQLHVSPVLRTPRLDAVLQVRPHQHRAEGPSPCWPRFFWCIPGSHWLSLLAHVHLDIDFSLDDL